MGPAFNAVTTDGARRRTDVAPAPPCCSACARGAACESSHPAPVPGSAMAAAAMAAAGFAAAGDFARLPVSRPEDAHEREADRVARQAVDGAAATRLGPLRFGSGAAPLPAPARAFFEERLGHDFTGVRVHGDARARHAAGALGAEAFTVGRVVYLGGPAGGGVEAGVLAHELAHVAQGAARPSVAAQVNRTLVVSRPSEHPTFGPPEMARMTRGQNVSQWLRELCPQASPSVDPSTGRVDLGNDAVCRTPAASSAGSSPQAGQSTAQAPVSCQCLCRAASPSTPQIDVIVEQAVPTTIRAQGTVARDVRPSGGALTIQPHETPYEITHPTIVTSGEFQSPRPLQGAGDPHSSSSGTVTTPQWLILAHELCGHVFERPDSPNSHLQTEAGNRSAVDVENQIRREHNMGVRRGAFVGGQGNASVWHLLTGDDLDGLGDRFGIRLRGWSAWDRRDDPAVHGWLTNVVNVEAGEIPRSDWRTVNPDTVADRMLRQARDQEHGEIVITGIAWDDVQPGDSWDSIATRWGILPGARTSPGERVRRANRGRLAAPTPGARVVIPPASAPDRR
jgi:hypothetical protein